MAWKCPWHVPNPDLLVPHVAWYSTIGPLYGLLLERSNQPQKPWKTCAISKVTNILASTRIFRIVTPGCNNVLIQTRVSTVHQNVNLDETRLPRHKDGISQWQNTTVPCMRLIAFAWLLITSKTTALNYIAARATSYLYLDTHHCFTRSLLCLSTVQWLSSRGAVCIKNRSENPEMVFHLAAFCAATPIHRRPLHFIATTHTAIRVEPV